MTASPTVRGYLFATPLVVVLAAVVIIPAVYNAGLAFFKYDAPVTSRRMSALLRERGVALRSGSEYGPSGEGYIRLAFAADRAAITEGMLRMRSTMAEAREGKIS